MKKKILAITLCVSMLAIAIVGGTLAYFTDKDQATNVFTVGNLDITLTEQVNHVDGAGNLKPMLKGNEEVKGLQAAPGIAYQHIMPGDEMTKIVTVSNMEEYPAYVALAIKQTEWGDFNQNIDDYFEGLDATKWAAMGFTGNTKDTVMQEVTDGIFSGSGWNGLSYDKYNNGFEIRYYPKNAAAVDQAGTQSYVGNTSTAPILIAVDYTVQQGPSNPGYSAGYKDNMFGTQFEDTSGLTLSRADEVYGKLDTGARMWVYYLYLPANASYELDLTMTCPTYITAENIEAFNDMSLDIQAAAIQVDGFATAKEAFLELNKTHGFDF